MYPHKIISGDIVRKLTAEQRGLYLSYVMLAGCGANRNMVCIADEIAYSPEQLEKILNVKKERIQTLNKELASIGVIKIDPLGVIYINDWSNYETEYSRRKNKRRTAAKPKRIEQTVVETEEVAEPDPIYQEVAQADKPEQKKTLDTYEDELVKETDEPFNVDAYMNGVREAQEEAKPKDTVADTGKLIRLYCETYKNRFGKTPIIGGTQLESAKELVKKYGYEDSGKLITTYFKEGGHVSHDLATISRYARKRGSIND